MLQKAPVFILMMFLAVNLCGCIPILAGAAAGGGTVVWLDGKLIQQVNAPYDKVVNAAKNALKSLRLEITKETRDAAVTQLKSKYTDGKEIWVDIRKITDDSSKIGVRVGAVHPDKEAADKILKRIERYL